MPPVELIVGLLLHLILPAIAASGLVGAVAAWRLPRRTADVGLAAATAAGLLAGNGIQQPLPYLPALPEDFGWRCLLDAAVLSLALSVIAALVSRRLLGLALLVIALPLVGICLMPAELRTPAWLGGFAALVLANAWVLARTARQSRRWWVPAMWAVALAGGAAIVLLHAHSARLTEAAILLAAALGGMCLVAMVFPVSLRWVAPTVALYLPGLMLAGYHETFSDVPAASFALVAAAPLPLGLLLLPAARTLPRSARVALGLLLPLAPVAVAVGLAIWAEGLSLGG